MVYVAISVGAVLGANARYLVGGWVADRLGATFPYGTFVINVTGSALIGLVLAIALERTAPDWVRPLVAVGFLGSYTTFSTFSWETLSLIRDGSWTLAVLNVVASVATSLVGVWLGTVMARAILGGVR